MKMTDVKRDAIIKKLTDDLASADFHLSLVIAALSSYRHSTILKPFPEVTGIGSPSINNGLENSQAFMDLAKVARLIPNLREVLKHIDEYDEQVIDLLYWSLTSSQFDIVSYGKHKFSDIQSKAGDVYPTSPPDFIFEIQYSANQDERFQEKAGNRDIFYAYHGSRAENFHSIINHGLNNHLNKTSLFGEGTYLSSELSVAMPYAPSGHTWEHSILGDQLAVIAVCQVIDDKSVKCQVSDENGLQRARSFVKGSLGGEVPEKYFVVQNNDMIRVKYLLVYATHTKRKCPVDSKLKMWIQEHKFILLMAFYCLLLVAIGLYNSKGFHMFMRKYKT